MIQDFRDVDWAVAYLCEGLPDGVNGKDLSVAWYPRGGELRNVRLVNIGRLGQTLRRLCERFSEATVVLETEKSHAPLAGIQCRCLSPGGSSCRCHCTDLCDRPIVTIMTCDHGTPPSEEERAAALGRLHGALINHQDEKRRRTSHGSGRNSRNRTQVSR